MVNLLGKKGVTGLRRSYNYLLQCYSYFFLLLHYFSQVSPVGMKTTKTPSQHFTQLRPTEKSSMMHRARLHPSSPALPTTDGRFSHNATRSQMPTEEVTNTLQVSVPLRLQCARMFLYVCALVVVCVSDGDKEHLSCRERTV